MCHGYLSELSHLDEGTQIAQSGRLERSVAKLASDAEFKPTSDASKID